MNNYPEGVERFNPPFMQQEEWSNCCGAPVYNDRCMDCKDMCGIIINSDENYDEE